MSIRHHNWLSLQSTRRYPLADTATGTDDTGQRLRDDIITDLHIRWPRPLGQYAFLGGLTVTPNIVTAVIMSAATQSGSTDFVPLAAVTLSQPVVTSRLYPMTPLQQGVGGFIAFGDVGEPAALRFSTPEQSLLLPRVARPYTPPPIPYFKKEGLADELTDIVQLLAGTGLEVVRKTVRIEGQDVDAIVIQLPAATLTENTLAEYIGPCGARPESGNCDVPGLETIAGVGPDCDGNINISFLNFVTAPYPCEDGYAGITLDQNIGLSTVCVQDTLFPFDGEDFCMPLDSEESSLSSAGPPPDDSSSDSPPPGPSDDSSDSSAMVPCEELPYLECFEPPWSDRWVVESGYFQPVEIEAQGDCQEYSSMSSMSLLLPGTGAQASDSSKRNVMIWEDCGVASSLNKRVSVRVQLTHQSFSQNAGLVLNHRVENPLLSSQPDYLLVGIDRNANRFMLQRYSGGVFIVEHAVSPATTFNTDDWYEITATAVPSGTNVLIQCLVQNITNPSWPSLSFLVATARWGSPTGFFGIHTIQSVSRFAAWRLEDV